MNTSSFLPARAHWKYLRVNSELVKVVGDDFAIFSRMRSAARSVLIWLLLSLKVSCVACMRVFSLFWSGLSRPFE